jgi:hypothetical protein
MGGEKMDIYATPADPSEYYRIAHDPKATPDRDGETFRWGIDSPDGLTMEYKTRKAAEKRIREIRNEEKRR